MVQNETPKAPSLGRGLQLLEAIAGSPEPVGFMTLLRRFDWPKASLSRILIVLREGGYVIKDDLGGYRVGPRAAMLSGHASLADQLRIHGEPLLRSLRDQTQNTAILLLLQDRRATCVAKAEHEASVPMQPVGQVRLDLSLSPWGAMYVRQMSHADQNACHAHMTNAGDFEAYSSHALQPLADHGYAYDDQRHVKHLRRLAAPVYRNGTLIAAIALGGNPLTLPDEQVETAAALLVQQAAELSEVLM